MLYHAVRFNGDAVSAKYSEPAAKTGLLLKRAAILGGVQCTIIAPVAGDLRPCATASLLLCIETLLAQYRFN